MKRDPQALEKHREFLRRHGAVLGTGAVVALVGIVALVVFVGGDSAPPPRKIPQVTMVAIQPPPPPPPPPPPIPVDQPKMVEQQKMVEPEFKPEQPRPKDEPPPKAPDAAPPGPLGLDTAEDGPGDAFNLAGRPGGNGLLGGGGGSRWGWYAYLVQQQVEDALRAHRRTRNAKTRVEVKLWADANGRVTRVQMTPSTGDAEVDEAIRNEVLVGLQLKEPPPKDMPMPIVARLTARRPG